MSRLVEARDTVEEQDTVEVTESLDSKELQDDNGGFAKESWELEKLNQELNRKSNRVEQARRNVEALTRLLPYLIESPNGFLPGSDIKNSIYLNIEVMNKVKQL